MIYEASDLGSIPSLFGHPTEYARFLGLELSLWYVGPLLVVMPAGFGIYDGGRSTAAETQVLQSIPLSAGSPDELARSANAALEALTAAGALDSPDVRAPLVTAHPASGTRGKRGDAALRCLRRQRPKRALESTSTTRARSSQPSVSPATFQIGTRNVAIALARAGEASKPAASLLRRRLRPSREPQRSRVRPFPSAQVSSGGRRCAAALQPPPAQLAHRPVAPAREAFGRHRLPASAPDAPDRACSRSASRDLAPSIGSSRAPSPKGRNNQWPRVQPKQRPPRRQTLSPARSAGRRSPAVPHSVRTAR